MAKKKLLSTMIGITVSNFLPENLIVTPATLVEDYESLTGFTISGGAIALNSSEVEHGTYSIKVTSESNTQTELTKINLGLDLSSLINNMCLWIYNHLSIDLSFIIYAGANNLSDHYYATGSLIPGWNKIYKKYDDWTVGGGTPNWNSIDRFDIRISAVVATVTITSVDRLEFTSDNTPAVMFTFDDNAESINTKAFAYLQPKRIPATAYAIGNLVSGAVITRFNTLYNAGWDIGNHSNTHTDFTTLTQAQIETELTDCKAVLDSNGWTRASDHVAYPYGSNNATSNLAMTATSMKTGRIVGGLYNMLEYSTLYKLFCVNMASTVSLATAKGYIDTAISTGRVLTLLFHGIVDSGASGDQWNLADFQALVDYVRSNQVQCLTISEYYRLLSGSITVRHN
jgi:peptidoglycan/xylan/chitin deacetylase (PgdA/CDA1 family)